MHGIFQAFQQWTRRGRTEPPSPYRGCQPSRLAFPTPDDARQVHHPLLRCCSPTGSVWASFSNTPPRFFAASAYDAAPRATLVAKPDVKPFQQARRRSNIRSRKWATNSRFLPKVWVWGMTARSCCIVEFSDHQRSGAQRLKAGKELDEMAQMNKRAAVGLRICSDKGLRLCSTQRELCSGRGWYRVFGPAETRYIEEPSAPRMDHFERRVKNIILRAYQAPIPFLVL